MSRRATSECGDEDKGEEGSLGRDGSLGEVAVDVGKQAQDEHPPVLVSPFELRRLEAARNHPKRPARRVARRDHMPLPHDCPTDLPSSRFQALQLDSNIHMQYTIT